MKDHCTCMKSGVLTCIIGSLVLALVLATGTTAAAQCPGEGDCCAANGNGSPGCDDLVCCLTVCGVEPFCCDVEWDAGCAAGAAVVCGDLCDVPPPTCGDEGAGDCCEATGSPACSDATCCEIVCAADAFCCETTWDGLCADMALELCGDLCSPPPVCGDKGAGDCCEATGSPACDDATCCEKVCFFDVFCCEVEWDSICAGEAADLCGELCDDPLPNDCCQANDTPGCDDPKCEVVVCGADPMCCDVVWDQACAEAAERLCGDLCAGPACPGDGDCCEPTGTPGCDDVECCTTVCEADAFCCDVEWDAICADVASSACGELCDGPGGCREDIDGNGAVDVEDLVSLILDWDCGGGGGPCVGDGDCCTANGTPGCEDAACCGAVCAIDVFCCDVEWDALCADQAEATCEICAGSAGPGDDCIGDVNNDGQTDVEDLVAVILAWGPCEGGEAAP